MSEDREYRRMVIIRKTVMVIVIVLLILWLVFFINVSKNSTKTDNVDKKYDDNMNLFKEAAVKYFTTNEKTIVSLKELYEKELIEKLTTTDEEECVDIASYALLKELEDKYQLDVVLVCGDYNTKITSYYDLGCGLICEITS